jgi:hypothetical protein
MKKMCAKNVNENVLCKDTCDGEKYSNFLNQETISNHYNQSFTFSIFTDHTSICKKKTI